MYVAAWNGDSWESMSLDDGALSTNSLQDYVGAITSFNGNLVVAGVFSRQHHAVANNIAMWDGSAWSDMDNPYFPFLTLNVYDGDLVASGHGYNYEGYLVPIFGYSQDGPLINHTVTIHKAGDGDGTFDAEPSQVVSDGSNLTITATPDANSDFVSWTGCDSTSDTICSLSNIVADRSLIVTFALRSDSGNPGGIRSDSGVPGGIRSDSGVPGPSVPLTILPKTGSNSRFSLVIPFLSASVSSLSKYHFSLSYPSD